MIFTAQNAGKILRGEKTQTRRPRHPNDTPHPAAGPIQQVVRTGRDKHGHPISTIRYRTGGSYALQPGRGRPSIGRVLITNIRLQQLTDITHRDAQAEGHQTTNDFRQAWVHLHDKAWVTRTLNLDDTTDDQAQALILARFDQRWTHQQVWAITIQPDRTDTPRLLTAKPGLQRADYTTNPTRAAPHEPEPLTQTQWERHVKHNATLTTHQWQALHQAHRDRDRQLLAFDERLNQAQRAARQRHIDITHELWLIHRYRTTRPEHATQRQLEHIERRLDQAA